MIYDLVMLVIVVITTIRGSAKGMAWQLAAIASLVLCFLFATPLSLVVAPMIGVQPPLNRWIAMLAIYLVFSFGSFSMARMVRSWFEAAKFEEYDKHLGAVFGLLKGAAFCFVVTFFGMCLSERASAYILLTNSGRASVFIVEQLHAVMPAEIEGVVAPDRNPRVIADDQMLADGRRDPDARRRRRADRAGRYEQNDFRGSTRQDTDVFGSSEPDPRPRRRPGRTSPSAPARNRADVPYGPSAPEQTQPSSLTDLVQGLPNVLDRGQELWGALKSAIPAESSTLLDSLKSMANGDGSGDLAAPPAPDLAGRLPAGSRQELIREIAAAFSNNAYDQDSAIQDIEDLVAGFPDAVAVAALEDWRGDVLGIGADIDPQTDLTTPLDTRLLRQLDRARISIRQLPPQLQQRLQSTR